MEAENVEIDSEEAVEATLGSINWCGGIPNDAEGPGNLHWPADAFAFTFFGVGGKNSENIENFVGGMADPGAWFIDIAGVVIDDTKVPGATHWAPDVSNFEIGGVGGDGTV